MSGWDYNVVFGSIIVLLALIVGFVLFLIWLLDRFLRKVFAKKQKEARCEGEA